MQPSTVEPSALAATSVTPTDAEPQRCEHGEQLLFHCDMQEDALSLCAIPESGAVRVRISHDDTTREAVIAAGSARLSTTAYAGGGEARIGFVDQDVVYSVFDRTVRTGFDDDGLNAPAFTAGVVETASATGETITRGCDNDASIRSYAYTHLEREDFAHPP